MSISVLLILQPLPPFRIPDPSGNVIPHPDAPTKLSLGPSSWKKSLEPLIPDVLAVTSHHTSMGPLERPTGWTHKEAEMHVGPRPDERSRGWGPGDRTTAPSPLPPALSFLLLLPLGECPPGPQPFPFPFLTLSFPSCNIMLGCGL